MHRRARLLLACVALSLAACSGGGAGHEAGASGNAGADGSAKAGTDGGAGNLEADALDSPNGESAGAALDAVFDDSDGAEAADGASGTLPRWRSGTRLRARLVKVAGGPDTIFQSVFDNDLGTACRFVTATDGATRCLPGSATLYFADGGCKTPILRMDTGCAPPTYVSGAVGCQFSGFKVGVKTTPATVFTGATCLGVGATGDFYELTRLGETTFVAATEQRDDRGAGLMMRYWKSDDGGLFPFGVWDSQRAASCVPGADDYADRCVPAAAVSLSGLPTYADDTCKKQVAAASADCEAEPVSAVRVPTSGTCGETIYYYDTSKLATVPYQSVQTMSGQTMCAPLNMPPAGETFYVVGDAIPSGALPDLPTVLDGTARLKLRRYESETSLPLDLDPIFYDAIHQSTCSPTMTTKGLRCVPTRAARLSSFADDKCTLPLYVESKTKPDLACALPSPDVAYIDKGGAVCGGQSTLELYEIGAAVTPSQLYFANPTMGCVASATDPATVDVFETTLATDDTTVALEIFTE